MALFWNKRDILDSSLSEGDIQQEGQGTTNELQSQNEELSGLVDAFKAENKELKASNKELVEQNKILKTENDSFKVKLAQYEEGDKALTKREKELKEWELKLKEREKTLDEHSGSCETSQSEHLTSTLLFSNLEKEIKEIKKTLDEVQYKDKIIKELHDELQKRNRDFYADIAKPYLKNIIKIFERISGTYKGLNRDELKTKEDALELAIRAVENDKLMIEDLLGDEYDMVYFEPEPGSEYMPKEHTAIQSIVTQQKELGGKIIECRQGGFRDANTGKVFKSAIVTVYKFDSNK